MAEEGEGKEVRVVLVRWDERLDILPKGPAETLKSLSRTVGDLIHTQGDSCPRELFEIKACLERFDAFLFQSVRLLEYLDLERYQLKSQTSLMCPLSGICRWARLWA
jgi:hypothetical protein